MKKEKQNLSSSVIVIALVLVCAMIAPDLDTTIVNIGIHTIGRHLNASLTQVQWVITSYILALGIAVPISGWLVDRFNGKKVMLGALSIFFIGSIISSSPSSLNILVIGRIIQGTGAGIIIPSMSTLAIRAAHGKNIGQLMAIGSLPIVFIPVIGPTVGGLILKYLNWHWLFIINIPLSGLALLINWWKLPDLPAIKANAKLNLPSLVLLSGTFIGLILATTKYSQYSQNQFNHASVVIPLIIGLGCLVLFIAYSAFFKDKTMIQLSLFKTPNFTATCILIFISGIIQNGGMFLLPLYLQNIKNYTVIATGIWLLSQGVGTLVVRQLTGKLNDKIGARWIVIFGLILNIITTLPFGFANQSTPTWVILTALFFRGIAQAALIIPLLSDAYTGLKQELVSQATTATRMFQNIGGAFGTACLSTLITSALLKHHSLTFSYNHAFLFTVLISIISIIPAFFLTHHKKQAEF